MREHQAGSEADIPARRYTRETMRGAKSGARAHRQASPAGGAHVLRVQVILCAAALLAALALRWTGLAENQTVRTAFAQVFSGSAGRGAVSQVQAAFAQIGAALPDVRGVFSVSSVSSASQTSSASDSSSAAASSDAGSAASSAAGTSSVVASASGTADAAGAPAVSGAAV